jgi:phosphohistidine phosphatase
MAIYLVQHGACFGKDEDPKKSLTPEGRRAVAAVAAHLQAAGITVARVCHSGKTRARQTAQVLADQLAGGRTAERAGMKPLDDVHQFAGGLSDDDTIYVGHLPHMEKLASYLTVGDQAAGVIKFTNGGVVCLEKDDGGYRIRWYLTPALCGQP